MKTTASIVVFSVEKASLRRKGKENNGISFSQGFSVGSFHFSSLHFGNFHFASFHFRSFHFASFHFGSFHFASLQSHCVSFS